MSCCADGTASARWAAPTSTRSLRNLGVSTIVAVGVSVNVAITNLVMDAVNVAYRVVVPRDAVAGIPADYATAIIDNTLSLLATITTTDDLIEAWKQRSDGHRGRYPRIRKDPPVDGRRFARHARRAAGHRRVDEPGRATVERRGRAHRRRLRALEEHRRRRACTRRARRDLPGNGHPLMPPWQVAESGPDEVTMRGHFSRFHVGGNNAVHGGVIPLFYDWHFGMVVSAAGRPNSRTAYLHVDYRKITPIDEPLIAGRIDPSTDARRSSRRR